MKPLNRRDALKLGGLAVGGVTVAASVPSEALAGTCTPYSLSGGTGIPVSARVAAALALADRAAARARQVPLPNRSFQVLTRRPGQPPESPIEKPVVLPAVQDRDPGNHAWAEARFWTDIMAEHALFIAMLIPPGTGEAEQAQAVSFAGQFLTLNERLGAMLPPPPDGVGQFVATVVGAIGPFSEFKARLGEAQRTGGIRSFAWPLFFREARLEAERAMRRLQQLAGGQSELDRAEVVSFWTENMEGHARMIWHLLDPDEVALIEQAM